MSWQPEGESFAQLAGLLSDSLNGQDHAKSTQALAMLNQAQQSPTILNYFTYIFLHPEPPTGMTPQAYHHVRQGAGISLKNQVRQHLLNMTPDGLEYLKSQILNGFKDPNFQIRKLTGNVIAEIVKQGGILGWTDLITQLIAIAEGNCPSFGTVTPEAQEGAMDALQKVCTDNRKQLEKEYNGSRPLDVLIPKFIEFTASPSAKVRMYALSSINVFLPSKSQSVIVHIDALLQALFRLASDPQNDIQKVVCRAFVYLIEIRPDKVAPHIPGIVDYMLLQQQKTDDEELALDAAEFWLSTGEHDQLKHALGPFLPKIIPVLLRSMVYSEDEIARLGGEAEDAHLEDRAEDMKPIFAKTKQRLPNGQTVEDGSDATKTPGEVALDELSDGELEDDDSEDEFGVLDDPEDEWNLRKCSAAGLDVLSNVYNDTILDMVLPYLKDSLRSEDWSHREAAVLALGAVAAGCMAGMTPHLPELIPFLVSLLNDKEPLVRQITCWTLGRYASWASHLESPQLRKQYFEPMMEGILMRMLDGNKRVQEAAVSAFANLEEQSKTMITPYIEPIVRQFVLAMEKYKDRNMYILYDCIQTLAEHVGAALAEPRIVNILMPGLINRWKLVKDDSRELFPLLECLSYVATALAKDFAPFSEPIFNRCISIIRKNLELYAQGLQAGEYDIGEWPDKDFLVTSIDLLSAIIQALDSDSAALVNSSQPPFFELLKICMADQSADVRQSAYALLGDCAIYVFALLQPYLPQIMALLIEELDISKKLSKKDEFHTGFSAVNNACWSCGEIALQQGAGMSPYVSRLYERLLNIIQTPNISSSLTENAAIALGRIGIGSYEELAPHLDSFAYPFLDALADVAETDEKDTALRGFSMVVSRNPEAMESCLVPYFTMIATYEEPGEELMELFRQTLQGYKGFIRDFDGFLSQLPEAERARLRQRYGV